VALEADMMQPDGLHPNKQAQPLLMDNVWLTLKPLLKKSVPSDNRPKKIDQGKKT